MLPRRRQPLSACRQVLSFTPSVVPTSSPSNRQHSSFIARPTMARHRRPIVVVALSLLLVSTVATPSVPFTSIPTAPVPSTPLTCAPVRSVSVTSAPVRSFSVPSGPSDTVVPYDPSGAVAGRPSRIEIRAAVILPADYNVFIISLAKVMPVLEIAVRQLYATGVLREAEVAFRFVQRDDKCEDIEAMRCGFHLVMERRVDLFLGPVCDYGVDLVARMMKFWNAPLLTTGGFTNDFSMDKRDPKSKYFLLVRTGTLAFQALADMVVSVLNRYSWKNVLLIYDMDGYWKVTGKQSCGLMTKTLVEMFKGNASIQYDSFDLTKNPHNNLTENLRNEVGSRFTSKHYTYKE